MKQQKPMQKQLEVSTKMQSYGKDKRKSQNAISKEELTSIYSPEMQYAYCASRERCVTGEAPTIGEVADQLGNETVIEWINAQLTDFTNFACNGFKPTAAQYREMALLILQCHKHLKLTAFMLFLNECKQGKHVKIYGGTVDPAGLMGALEEFTSTVIPLIISQADGQADVYSDYKALVEDIIYRIRAKDFEGEDGEIALDAQEMILRGDFTDDEIGRAAREAGEYLARWFAPVYANRIRKGDFSGEIGETAKVIWLMIGNKRISNNFWQGGIEREVKAIIEGRSQGEKKERGKLKTKDSCTGIDAFEKYLAAKARNRDFTGYYGRQASKKAIEMEKNKDMPF